MTTLSPFLKEKLVYYFDFFDADGDGMIANNDLDLFIKKILDYTGWSENSNKAKELREIHEAFFEVLLEKALHDDKKVVNLQQWLKIWHQLIQGSMGMHNFPVWLRLLPKSLFLIIDRNEDNLIQEDELAEFYEKIVHLEAGEAKKVAKKAYEDMTDHGRYPLTPDGYEQIFANFLLGRTPYGPGRFIFGCFEHNVEKKKFKLIQGPPEDEEEEEMEIENRRMNMKRRGSDSMKVVLVTRRGSYSGK